jgi:hypothetical protein
MNKNWHGLLKIEQIEQIRNGEVIWKEENIKNLFHTQGEMFILSCCFSVGGGISVPANYYFGLDNRTTIAAGDTMALVVDEEPTGSGYARQSVSSAGDFAIDLVGSNYRAISRIVSFTATGAYGPVRNLFLTTAPDATGYLISSATLSSPLTFASGDIVNLRMSLQLQDC